MRFPGERRLSNTMQLQPCDLEAYLEYFKVLNEIAEQQEEDV